MKEGKEGIVSYLRTPVIRTANQKPPLNLETTSEWGLIDAAG
jgi:hypothetical protein